MAVPIEEDEERSLLAEYVATTLSFGIHNNSLATMVVDAVLETKGVADGPDYDYYDEEDELGSIAIRKVYTWMPNTDPEMSYLFVFQVILI